MRTVLGRVSVDKAQERLRGVVVQNLGLGRGEALVIEASGLAIGDLAAVFADLNRTDPVRLYACLLALAHALAVTRARFTRRRSK